MATPNTINAEWIRSSIESGSVEDLADTVGTWCDEYPTLADEVRDGTAEASTLMGALDHDLSL